MFLLVQILTKHQFFALEETFARQKITMTTYQPIYFYSYVVSGMHYIYFSIPMMPYIKDSTG